MTLWFSKALRSSLISHKSAQRTKTLQAQNSERLMSGSAHPDTLARLSK